MTRAEAVASLIEAARLLVVRMEERGWGTFPSVECTRQALDAFDALPEDDAAAECDRRVEHATARLLAERRELVEALRFAVGGVDDYWASLHPKHMNDACALLARIDGEQT